MILSPSSELVIDQTSVHPTSQSYISGTKKFLTEIFQEEIKTGANVMYNKGDRSSPAVARRQKEKHDKYQPVMHILQTLVMRRKKTVKPKFLAPVISHLGELSGDAFTLFDLMSDEYKQRAKQNYLFIGVTPAVARARFRRRLIDATMMTLAGGMSRQVNMAGIPIGRGDF
jgi:hypothetical protein